MWVTHHYLNLWKAVSWGGTALSSQRPAPAILPTLALLTPSTEGLSLYPAENCLIPVTQMSRHTFGGNASKPLSATEAPGFSFHSLMGCGFGIVKHTSNLTVVSGSADTLRFNFFCSCPNFFLPPKTYLLDHYPREEYHYFHQHIIFKTTEQRELRQLPDSKSLQTISLHIIDTLGNQ